MGTQSGRPCVRDSTAILQSEWTVSECAEMQENAGAQSRDSVPAIWLPDPSVRRGAIGLHGSR